MRLSRALALLANTVIVAAATFTAAPAGATTTPWADDRGLVLMGDGAELPTAPRDVWAGLHNRTITTLGNGTTRRSVHAPTAIDAGTSHTRAPLRATVLRSAGTPAAQRRW